MIGLHGFSDRGILDVPPLSLIGEPTIATLSQEVGMALDDRRFRANLYARWASEQPFYEDTFVGRRLKIGDTLTVLIEKRDPRCNLIGIDSETAALDKRVLRTVSHHHESMAGVYAAVLHDGIVQPGDPIQLLP